MVCHNKAQLCLPGVAPAVQEAPGSPWWCWLRPLGAESKESWGSPASLHALGVLWVRGDQHRRELCWLQGTRHALSLCRCFPDKWVELHGFPADFSRVKSESLREERQQQQSSKAISSLLSLKRYSWESTQLLQRHAAPWSAL